MTLQPEDIALMPTRLCGCCVWAKPVGQPVAEGIYLCIDCLADDPADLLTGAVLAVLAAEDYRCPHGIDPPRWWDDPEAGLPPA